MPNQILGSDLEILVYSWLVKYGYQPNVDFDFQSHLIGGHGRQLGDAIVDFVLIKINVLIRVQGEYWHHGVQERARDRIQKERLQGLGYVVVDLWEEDLKTRLDYTMRQAMQGIEMPHYATYRGRLFPASTIAQSKGAGIIPIPGRVSGPNTIQGDLIDVLTKNPTGLADGEATLNGKLLHDGGVNSKCRFKYDEAKVETSPLCILFPWRFFALINLFSPNIELDFAGTPSAHNHTTVWQEGKRSGDEFSQALTGLTPTKFYSYLAHAKNDIAEDEGESIIFSQ